MYVTFVVIIKGPECITKSFVITLTQPMWIARRQRQKENAVLISKDLISFQLVFFKFNIDISLDDMFDVNNKTSSKNNYNSFISCIYNFNSYLKENTKLPNVHIFLSTVAATILGLVAKRPDDVLLVHIAWAFRSRIQVS